MSWSIQKTGRGVNLAKSVREEADRYACAEPEESAKQAVASAVEKMVEAAPNLGFVINAYGSQSSYSDKGITNMNLNVDIKAFEFVE
jgi:hypothetical protein